jgi:hypothetical protein
MGAFDHCTKTTEVVDTLANSTYSETLMADLYQWFSSTKAEFRYATNLVSFVKPCQ